jgi:hypothetical protein
MVKGKYGNGPGHPIFSKVSDSHQNQQLIMEGRMKGAKFS